MSLRYTVGLPVDKSCWLRPRWAEFFPEQKKNVLVYYTNTSTAVVFPCSRPIPACMRGCEGQASLFRATARPIHAKTELKHTKRGTQHCNNGRPTPVCDPYWPSLKYSVTHSSSMKGPRLNFHAERELEHPKTTFFSSFLQLQQYTHVRRRRVVCR